MHTWVAILFLPAGNGLGVERYLRIIYLQLCHNRDLLRNNIGKQTVKKGQRRPDAFFPVPDPPVDQRLFP